MATIAALIMSLIVNRGLREKNIAYEQIIRLQSNLCSGLNDVNSVCEKTLYDLVTRLGLDVESLPVAVTPIMNRASKRYGFFNEVEN